MTVKTIAFLVLLIPFLAACGEPRAMDDRAASIYGSETRGEGASEDAPCITKKTVIVRGTSMLPLLDDGAVLTLAEHFYECGNLPQKGDLVAYDFAGNKFPLIKTVVATDQSTVTLEGDTLRVDGATLKNSAGKTYFFTDGEKQLLQMYFPEGKLPEDSMLILGDNTKNSEDSRKFGAVAIEDVLGRFFPRSAQ